MMKAYVRLQNLIARQEGQGMTEYGLIVALIAVALIAVLGSMSKELSNTFKDITKALQ